MSWKKFEICPACGHCEIDKPENIYTGMEFPVHGKVKTWVFTTDKIQEYKEAFPALEITYEARKALQWCLDNPKRQKTAQGMPRFLFQWFSTVQNKGVKKNDPRIERLTERI